LKTARSQAQRRALAVRLMSEGEPMSTGLAGLLLGVSPKTVARWCRDGRVPTAMRPNEDGQWRIPAAEVARRLLSENKGDRNG
jgi:Helix-turn-helix domain